MLALVTKILAALVDEKLASTDVQSAGSFPSVSRAMLNVARVMARKFASSSAFSRFWGLVVCAG